MNRQEEMNLLIEQQRSSGQSAKQFCEEHDIKYSTFNYWIRKKKQNVDNSFIPIQMMRPAASQNGVDLFYPNGVRLHLRQFELGQIHQLLKLV